MTIATVNPTTGRLEQEFEPHTPREVADRLAAADDASRQLRTMTIEQRGEELRTVADTLESEVDKAAAMVVTEMGKPIRQARAEVLKCVRALRFYAANGAEFLADEPLANPSAVGASRAGARYRPLGVVLAVMPWNYPLWQVVRFAAPALMAGNAVVLKHASNVPRSAQYLDSVFEDCQLPPGSFRTLLVGSDAVPGIVADPRIKAVTLTGSEPAGAAVATAAAAHLKKSVLELGGSDPFIVLPSADLEAASSVAVQARVSNNGQSCIAAKRFIVHADIYDDFVSLFVEKMAALTVGDPTEESTDVGPLATSAGREQLAALVADAVSRGARVLTGGAPVDRPGWFFLPTVIDRLTEDMQLATAEAFGPLASVWLAGSSADALRIANATEFGLSSSVWTTDRAEREFFLDGLEAGAVFVNGMTVSYPELPFGGTKRSGYGRELAAAGIREFTNLQTIWEA